MLTRGVKAVNLRGAFDTLTLWKNATSSSSPNLCVAASCIMTLTRSSPHKLKVHSLPTSRRASPDHLPLISRVSRTRPHQSNQPSPPAVVITTTFESPKLDRHHPRLSALALSCARPARTLVCDQSGPLHLLGTSHDGTLVPTSRARRHSH
jgi:hypothetical protein